MFRRRRIIKIAVILAIATVSILDHLGVFGYRGGDRTRYDGAVATITYAADGDTVDIDMPDGDRSVTRVRLWGVDCPETAQRSGEPDAHYGPEAKAFAREHLVGRRVRVALDPERTPRGKYGRLLAYLYFVDTAECVNELLLEKGLAYADWRFPHVMSEHYTEIERQARRARAGLWKDVVPEQMPDWRQRMESHRSDGE